MNAETKARIRQALEDEYGRATDNAARARHAERGSYMAADAALFREYYREESAAKAALLDFDPSWTPRKAFAS